MYLQCEVAACAAIGDGAREAAGVAGWNFKTLNFEASNPATLVTAMNNALQYKPEAVLFRTGAPASPTND